mmetsp:Transcript_3314/g.2767  ORF Transcript_3314/g.2767 Transcript_3314/m.2767 type:complete len:152 (+) Transcript_3314:310-765(+)
MDYTENIPLNFINQKQPKSQLGFYRANSQFGEYQSYMDLKQNREIRTIDTEEYSREKAVEDSDKSNDSIDMCRKYSQGNSKSRFTAYNNCGKDAGKGHRGLRKRSEGFEEHQNTADFSNGVDEDHRCYQTYDNYNRRIPKGVKNTLRQRSS